MDITTTVSKIFKQYISSRIPKSQTNVFWMMFNGIDSVFTYIETLIRINKRERNILTAQSVASLRSHAANNGFEPTLKIASSGIVSILINPKLFARVGYPLYLPPYAILKIWQKNTLTTFDSGYWLLLFLAAASPCTPASAYQFWISRRCA